MRKTRQLLGLLLAAALCLGLLAAPASAASDAPAPAYEVDTTIKSELHTWNTQVAKGFAIASRVLRGDGGALNWDQVLTRAEAATMLVRLMGMEDEAEAAKSQPSPFIDVPAWANGYVNVAYAEKIASGIGDGRFAPGEPCRVQDFITMLYRMTNLTEGVDFSWGTALEDLAADTREIDSLKVRQWSPNIPFKVNADRLELYFQYGGAFTREAACDVIYFMLNISAGPDGESLGDLLAEHYGMSDMLLYNHSVRRTGYAMRGAAELTFEGFSGSTPTVVSVRDGRLYVEDSHKAEFFVDVPTASDPLRGADQLRKPHPPAQGDLSTTLSYLEKFLAGYDEDGDPLYGGRGRSEKFTVTYKDGEWSLSKWPSGKGFPDYAYIYAYQSEEHWDSFRRCEDTYQEQYGDASQFSPEITALANKLTAGKTTELAKADAICEWVATHIYYDYAVLKRSTDEIISSQVPEVVLERRMAICEGFDALTCALMRAAGLKCYSESGKGVGKLHGWNVAFLDGSWVVIDNTWDSPLEYEKTAGSGYQCRYDDPTRIWRYATPSNIMEPGAARRDTQMGKIYFNMDYDKFYAEHLLLRDPVMGSRTVHSVDHVLKPD